MMFNMLRKLFHKSKSVPDHEAFLHQLRDVNIFIIASIQGDGIDPKELTQEILLEQIRQGAKDLSERQSFEPFVYLADGQRRLPFFTSMDYAKNFTADYSTQRNRVYPFQLLEVQSSLLAQLLPACDVLIMNDCSKDAVEFSDSAMTSIQRMWV